MLYWNECSKNILERSFFNVKQIMSGKPQYDEGAAIASALDVFWRHGYGGASINNLTLATGLSRSSIYQRFGDKDGLFAEVLVRYTEVVTSRMRRVQAATPRETVTALLHNFVPSKGANAKPPGCLLARCCTEMADLPADAKQLVKAGIVAQRTVFEELIRSGIAREELSASVDVGSLAWYYIGVLQAVVNLPQAGATDAAMNPLISTAMLSWPQSFDV